MNLAVNLTNNKKASDNVPVTFNPDDSPCSYLYDDVWDFTAERKVRVGGLTKITFSFMNNDHKSSIQEALFSIHKHSDIAISGLDQYRAGLGIIASHLNSTDWSLLNYDVNFNTFKKGMKSKKYPRSLVSQTLRTINKLETISLTTRFVASIYSLCIKLCCPNSIELKQTIAIPEKIGKNILSTAIDIIEKYHPFRHEISNEYKKYNKLRSELTSVDSRFPKIYNQACNHNIPDFKLCGMSTDAVDIQTACMIVILGFSGVRISEALSFNKESYSEKRFKDITVSLLTGSISKTQTCGTPTQETWVTNPIVKLALELGYDMSEFSRDFFTELIGKKTNKAEQKKMVWELKSVFIKLTEPKTKARKGRVITEGWNRRFYNFIKKYKFTATKEDVTEFNILNPTRAGELEVDGYLPRISPHDFRRTFAVFLVRNKLGNMMTLKHQYKHANIVMTQWYANHSQLAAAMDLGMDTELQRLITEANEQITVDTLFNIYNSETLSGKEGERLIRERNKEEYAGTIYMSRKDIERRVKVGSVSLVEHPTGYCMNPSCDRICASDKSAYSCQHEIVTPEKAMSRVSVRERLIQRYKTLIGTSYMANILTNIYIEIKSIEVTLTAHNIGFAPFSKGDNNA